MAMIINFDRGNGQSPEQMSQSLMESVQMALDTMERKLSAAGLDLSGDNVSLDKIILNKYHPVGSHFTTEDPDFDPNTEWGGTWERIKDRFILAAGDSYSIGSTGGSADAVNVSHAHSIAHTHTPAGNTYKFLASPSNIMVNSTKRSWPSSSSGGNYLVYADDAQGINEYATTSAPSAANSGYSGEDGTGKNMPPYVTAYVWKRTA